MRTLRKSELADLYGISLSTLSRLLNKKYFHEIEPLGYVKSCVTLPPVVVRKFMDLYGKPLGSDEI